MRTQDTVKSATAFRTISEVSAELEVPQHVLRFWETKFPQIRPMKRGGGRRYYRPEDVELLRRIQRLLYKERYTIKGVQLLLKEGRSGGPESQEPEPVGTDLFHDEDEGGALPDSVRREIVLVLDELKALRALLGARGEGKDTPPA